MFEFLITSYEISIERKIRIILKEITKKEKRKKKFINFSKIDKIETKTKKFLNNYQEIERNKKKQKKTNK